MHELAVEKVVGCCVRVAGVETPSWFAFRIGTHDGDGEVGLKVFEMSD
jgi:hypothetical protein